MRRILHWGAFAILALSTTVNGAQAADPVETVTNPSYREWASFNLCASATHKQTVVYHEKSLSPQGRPGNSTEEIIQHRLVGTAPDRVIVEMTVTEVSGDRSVESAPVKISFPATVKRTSVESPKDKFASLNEGDEDVSVLGITLRCHWVETTHKDGERTSTQKVWLSNSVPGALVKEVRVVKHGGTVQAETTTELVNFSSN